MGPSPIQVKSPTASTENVDLNDPAQQQQLVALGQYYILAENSVAQCIERTGEMFPAAMLRRNVHT